MNRNTKQKAALARRNSRAELGKGNKGPNINSSELRALKGRKPWKGAGDPLKRGKPDYNFSTPDPQGSSYFRGMGQPVVEAPRPRPVAADLIGASAV